MTVQILTDSACDLPREVLDEYNVDYVPLMVILDGEEYAEGTDITPDEVYHLMKEGKSPTTAQTPPQQMKTLFETYAGQQTPCLYIGFSSGLSGTYQAAVTATDALLEEHPDYDITVFDSRSASIGEGFLVLEAARMAGEGKSKDEILDAISYQRDHMEHIFTVDDLEYLLRGGRISRTSAFVGNLLNIKPILGMNQEGELVPVEKVRGRKKVYKRIVEMVQERMADPGEDTIALPHAQNQEAADQLETMIKDATGATHFIKPTIGAVIGSHAGPGTFAAVFLKK